MEKMSRFQVKTKARAPLAMASATSPKKRKIVVSQDFKLSASSFVRSLSSSDSPASEEERCSSFTSNESPSSCCSSNGSFEENRIIKFSDLEVESEQVETSTCKRKRRETSTLQTNSQEMEKKSSTQRKSRSVLSTKPKQMPTESELEEFFSAAEKNIQKRFSDKYNYDIVKDVPLEGRYEWVQLKP